MIPNYDPFIMWLGNLVTYARDSFGINMIDIYRENPEMALRHYILLRDEFNKGTPPEEFANSTFGVILLKHNLEKWPTKESNND